MDRLTKALLACLLTAVIPPCVAAQTVSTSPESKSDYSQESYVIERLSQKVEFQNDGTSTTENMMRARVQSDAGVKQLGLLVFQYLQANDTMEVSCVRVLKPDGTTVTTPAGNIQDLPAEVTREAPFYSDVRQKHVAVRGLSPGDRLEYLVRNRTHTPLIPGQFWLVEDFTQGVIVLEETLEVSVPAERTVKTKFGEPKPVVAEEGGRRIYRWKTANLKSKTQDELVAQMIDPPPPAVQFTTFQSYEEVGRWYEGLQRDRVEPTAEIRAKAAELTQSAQTNDEKLKAIYNFVALNFRYIGIAFGIGRYQPNSAADVLANQYGDCKDKHTLLASLFRAAGIPAYPALINSSRKTDPDMPSPSQFNHVITAVPEGDHYLWLDSTAEVAPFGFLLYGLRDKQGLVIPPANAPSLVTTPSEPPFPTVYSFRIEGKLDNAGTLEAKVSRSLRGDAEVIMRAAFRRMPRPQWKDLLQTISYSSGFGGTVSDIDVSAPEATDAAFRFDYNYTRKDYSEWKKHRLSMPCPPLGLPLLKDDEEEKREKLTLGGRVEFVCQGRVELPEDVAPDLPLAVDLEEEFAEYHSSYAFKDKVLSSQHHLIVKAKEISEEKFEAYREFVKAANDDARTLISVLVSADDLNAAAAKLLDQKKEFSQAIDFLLKAVTKDPDHKWAWNNLGRAYAAIGNASEAEKAYKKQIEVNPNDKYAYKNLGWLYSRQQRYDEAASVYRDHAETNPLDEDDYLILGLTLEETGKYDEAIETYSKLALLNSDKPRPYVAWARALLKAGRKDEARKHMERALELDTSPSTLNNVAYYMADAGMDLDENEQRAQRAVDATVRTMSTPLSLDGAPPDYQKNLAELSAFLDTLGWVIFQKGELGRSEPYLRSSYLLFGGPAVAAHLARLYARQDRFEDALRYYGYALVQSGGKRHFDKALVAYLTEKTGGPDALQARAREFGSKLGDQRMVTPGAGAFSWPADVTRTKSAYVTVAVLADERGVVTDARVVDGDKAFRSAALADARALHLPPIEWPGHTLAIVRSINFLYLPPSMVSPEKRVKAWWSVGMPPPNNVTMVTPDGEHVVSVPAEMASGAAGSVRSEDSSGPKAAPAPSSYVDLMRQGASLLMSRDIEGGIAKFREALKVEPDCSFCHQVLAEALLNKGDRAGTILEYKELVRLEPNNAEYHYMLGLHYEAQGAGRVNAGYRFDRKSRSIRSSSAVLPEDTRADYEAAVEQYRIAHELAPDNKSYKGAYERLQRQLKQP